MHSVRRLLLSVVITGGLAGAPGALAAPPPAGGLEPAPGVSCIGSTALATGCAATSAPLQAVQDVAVSRDGSTIYALTAYAGGSVVAIRRQADGSLGAVLGCASGQPSAACATVVPSLQSTRRLIVGPAGQIITVSESAVTALSAGPDGNVGPLINCITGFSGFPGCTTRDGLAYAENIAVSPGGTLYVASFAGYTDGTVVALGTTASGAIGDELNCWRSPSVNPAYGCTTNTTGRIASPSALAVAPDGTVYVASSEYKASYGVVTAFPVAPGGALQAPANCVSDTSAAEPSTSCGATAPGLKGARALAISPDRRLYVGASPFDGSSGSISVLGLQASGAVGTPLNCLGSDVSTGCPATAGLRGINALVVAPDGNVYSASNYGASDGAATALSRQANGALSGVIDCIGVTSATGCGLRMTSLAGASGIAGSPDATMQDLYVGGSFTSGGLNPGSDGAVVALTRELPPACGDTTVQAVAGRPLTIPVPCGDPNGDPLTRTVVRGPGGGTLDGVDQGAGTVVYHPAAGFTGRDSFTVQATDGTLGSGTSTVNIDVTPAPGPPPGPGPGGIPGHRATLSLFALTRKRFAVGLPSSRPPARHRTAKGTAFRYKVDLPGTARISFVSCRRGTGKKKRDLCGRQSPAGSLSRTIKKAGTGTLPFTGQVGGRKLKPGRYRASMTVTPAAPNTRSAARTADFTVAAR